MMVKVVPKAGLKVRDPESKAHLSPEGEDRVLTGYWLRREKDGEVSIVRDLKETKEFNKKK